MTRGRPGSRYEMRKLVPNRVYSGGFNVPELKLRYLGALGAKQEHYKRSLLNDRLAPRDAYCAAICGGMVHMHGPLDPPEPMPPIIVDALCGLDVRKGSSPVSGRDMLRRDPAMSAVIFQPSHIKNRPEAYQQENGRDLVVVLNPAARTPLPWQTMKSGRVFDGQGRLVKDMRDPALTAQDGF